MKPAYVPILKALGSEFDAIAKIKNDDITKIDPLFEIPRIGKNILEAVRFQDHLHVLKTAYLNEVVGRIAGGWSGRKAMIDAYQWAADATIESGEHIIPYIYARLTSLGVSVVPVIGYDRWENDAYRLAMKSLNTRDGSYCIRLDSHAIEDSAEPDFFQDNIDQILDDISADPGRCSVLIDFGDVTGQSVDSCISKAGKIISMLESKGFELFVVSGCSLPKTIDAAVKKPDSTGPVLRREMLLWQAMRREFPETKIAFSDYGVRGPHSNDGVRNKHTNGKIRYTIDKQFFVVRGHSMSLPGKGEQMYGLAKTLMDSPHYMGEGFSWGDWRIAECSRKKFKGGAAQWIAIDTSHHLAYVVAEVEEFERGVAVRNAVRDELI